MKKNFLISAALSVLLAIGALGLTGCGSSTAEPAVQQAAAPTVPVFQGVEYAADTDSITVSALTEEDALVLEGFPSLKTIDGTACTDPTWLRYLEERHPDWEIRYTVHVGNAVCSNEDTTLTLSGSDLPALEAALPMLPKVKQLVISDPSGDAALNGLTISTDAASLDFSGKEVSLANVQALLPCLPQLKTLNLSGTGIAEDDVVDLRIAYPETNIISTVDLGDSTVTLDSTKALLGTEVFPRDCERIDLTAREVDVEQVERRISFFPNLKKITMLNAKLDCAYMDEVDQRHPEVRFVWTVPCGGISVRSDTLYFYPGKFFPGGEAVHTRNLKYCRDLVAVDLGHFWTYDLDWTANTPHLKFLILMNSRVSDLSPLAKLKELTYLEIFETNMVLDYTPLLECKSLRDINIGINEADPSVFGQMTWLNNLHWNDISLNDEWKEIYSHLPEMLPDTRVATTGFGMLANGWRFLGSYYAFRDLIDGIYLNQEEGYKYWGNDFMPIMRTEHSRIACSTLAEIVARRIENGERIPGIKDSRSDRAKELYNFLLEMQAIIDTREE